MKTPISFITMSLAERVCLTMRQCSSWPMCPLGACRSVTGIIGWFGVYLDGSVLICNLRDRTTVTFNPSGDPYFTAYTLFKKFCAE